jgi:CRP-like cAMP-binding protein
MLKDHKVASNPRQSTSALPAHPSSTRSSVRTEIATCMDGVRAHGPAGPMMGRGLITVCASALQRKLSGYVTLNSDHLSELAALEKKWRFIAARREIRVDESDGSAMAWLIGNGWIYSYTLLPGGERQIVGFHLPGDLIWPGGYRGHRPSHSFATITDCLLCEIDEAALAQLRRSQTRLSDALDWADSRDEAILEQHLVSVGRRPAIARVAHLLLELATRLRLVAQANEHGYRCPLSQELMADALGLTSIHVNRMLRELRELGCLTFRNGYVDIHAESRLVRLADFDPSYLDQEGTRSDPAAEQHAAGVAGSAGGPHQLLSR